MTLTDTIPKESPAETLERIQAGHSKNDERVISMIAAHYSIDPETVHPRENVLTYKAWKSKGYQVKKGEKAFRIQVISKSPKKDKVSKKYILNDAGSPVMVSRKGNACVFFEAQVKRIGS